MGPRPTVLRRVSIGVLVGALLLAVAQLLIGSDGPAEGMSASTMTRIFDAYGDTSGLWAGGDGTASVPLPDGRIAWLFSDTLVGPVNADHSLPGGASLVSNSIVIQAGTQLTGTLFAGTVEQPGPLVDTATDGEFYWVADATVEGSGLAAIYNRYRRAGPGRLDFTLVGSALATFDLPSLSLRDVAELPVGDSIAWGSALVTESGYTYVYGTESVPGGATFAHLARAPAQNLGGAWQYWSGSAWTDTEAGSGRLLAGVGTSFGVQRIGDRYVLVTFDGSTPFARRIVAYTARQPWGPFDGPTPLFTVAAESGREGRRLIVYDARLHPELARPGKLLISYNRNSLVLTDVRYDVRLYRPSFVEVDWPPSPP
jgi:uncharacterized protein DUF4185